MKAKTKKRQVKHDFLSPGPPTKFMRDITMMRTIDAGLLKKDGSTINKHGLIESCAARLKQFKKKSKDYQKLVMEQVKPIKDNRPPKCPHCGHRPTYQRDDGRSMRGDFDALTPEQLAWSHVGDR